MIIAIDFDGTCVANAFPEIGEDIGAVPVLYELVAKGHKLILYTMRSDVFNPQSDDHNIHTKSGRYLSEAIKWFKQVGVPLYSVQQNPSQWRWTKSPKCYAQLYIDDSALGCPLKQDPEISDKPFVDWVEVRRLLKESKIL